MVSRIVYQAGDLTPTAFMLTGPTHQLIAQDDYPVRPRPLPDAEGVVLATSAAPAAISGAADVYVVRDSER